MLTIIEGPSNFLLTTIIVLGTPSAVMQCSLKQSVILYGQFLQAADYCCIIIFNDECEITR